MYSFIQKNVSKNKNASPSNIYLALADRIPATGNSSYDSTVKEWLLKGEKKKKAVKNERIGITGKFFLSSSEKLHIFTKNIFGMLQGIERNRSDPSL